MKEYIDREAAIAAFVNYLGATSKTAAFAVECILKPIPAAPVIPINWIEAQVDKGKWAELVQRWREAHP